MLDCLWQTHQTAWRIPHWHQIISLVMEFLAQPGSSLKTVSRWYCSLLFHAPLLPRAPAAVLPCHCVWSGCRHCCHRFTGPALCVDHHHHCCCCCSWPCRCWAMLLHMLLPLPLLLLSEQAGSLYCWVFFLNRGSGAILPTPPTPTSLHQF